MDLEITDTLEILEFLEVGLSLAPEQDSEICGFGGGYHIYIYMCACVCSCLLYVCMYVCMYVCTSRVHMTSSTCVYACMTVRAGQNDRGLWKV